MTWLVWRQHRSEALLAGLVLAALAAVLVVTGREIASAYVGLGIAACDGPLPGPSYCNDVISAFNQQFGSLNAALPWLNFLPAVLAILVGAPLVAREFENRTQQLVWTQSVTRLRWLIVKLALILGTARLAWLILTLLITWWRGPFDALNGNLTPDAFDFEGIVPLAYVVFALALAIAAGAILRKSIPAMAITLAGYLAVRLPIDSWLRQRYLPPLTANLGSNNPIPFTVTHGWILGSDWVDRLGHPISESTIFNDTCRPTDPNVKSGVLQCLQSHGFQQLVTYQPPEHFWAFQGIETGIYVGLALMLVGLTIWWVRRRIA